MPAQTERPNVIELPESVTIARQISGELSGKQIAQCVRGNSPHKFAFYTKTPEEYADILRDKTIGEAHPSGACLDVAAQPGYVIRLGGGGERILYHRDDATIPAKYQLLLRFKDDSCLTVNVQGWGSCQLYEEAEVGRGGVSPLSPEFTRQRFQDLFDAVPPEDKRSIKFFMITDPGVWGVGNGYLQDILYRAELHPRRRANTLTSADQRALYDATVFTMTEAVRLGGRTSELDLHGKPGGYQRILHSGVVGAPCQRCGTPIEKQAFLGGSVYFCPSCQQ
jgi:formamidopyrimidine-DNA glycosylase